MAEILWSVFSGLLHQHAAQSLKTVKVEFFSWEEGLCVQCMHIGPYDDDPATVAAMEAYAVGQGYGLDFSQSDLRGSDLCIGVSYSVEFFFNPFGLAEFSTTQQASARMWGASLTED